MTAAGPSRRAVASALALVFATLAACAGQGSDVSVGAGDESVLPTLPPLEERRPDDFADDGCPVDEPECTSTAQDADRAAAQPEAGPDEERMLLGFTGTGWLVNPSGSSLQVLEESVTYGTGPWSAQGLVRNETSDPADGVVVRASLLDASGATLEVVSGEISVPQPLRPGEPAPFELTGDVASDAVASVRWEVTGSPTDDQGARAVSPTIAWVRPADGDEPVETYLYTDPAGSRPYVLFGTVENVGDDASGAAATLAWLVDDRVVHIETVDAECISGDLPSGETCDLLAVVDDPGRRLADAAVTIWTWSR